MIIKDKDESGDDQDNVNDDGEEDQRQSPCVSQQRYCLRWGWLKGRGWKIENGDDENNVNDDDGDENNVNDDDENDQS